MRILIIAAGTCALALGSAAAAADSNRAPERERQPAQAERTEEQRTEPRRLICRTIETSGTRLGSQRVCMTREGWERARRLT